MGLVVGEIKSSPRHPHTALTASPDFTSVFALLFAVLLPVSALLGLLIRAVREETVSQKARL